MHLSLRHNPRNAFSFRLHTTLSTENQKQNRNKICDKELQVHCFELKKAFVSPWKKVDVRKLFYVIRKYNMYKKNRLKTGTVEGPCRKGHPLPLPQSVLYLEPNFQLSECSGTLLAANASNELCEYFNTLVNHEINLHTLLHSPVLHLGHGILLHVKVDRGLVFGSHWEFSPIHSTVRFLRPLPHVTEHCNGRYEQYSNNVLGV